MALISKGTAGPPQARLDLVRNERRVIVAGQFASPRPKCRADGINAALSLDWFDNDGANRIVEFSFQISDVVKAHKFEPVTARAASRRMTRVSLGCEYPSAFTARPPRKSRYLRPRWS